MRHACLTRASALMLILRVSSRVSKSFEMEGRGEEDEEGENVEEVEGVAEWATRIPTSRSATDTIRASSKANPFYNFD